MKFIIFFLMAFCFLNGLTASEQRNLDRLLASCKDGIADIQERKIYFHSNRLGMIRDQTYLLSDSLEWIPVGIVLRDACGNLYVESHLEELKVQQRCPRFHVGHQYSQAYGIWFCLNQCPFNFSANFPDSKIY